MVAPTTIIPFLGAATLGEGQFTTATPAGSGYGNDVQLAVRYATLPGGVQIPMSCGITGVSLPENPESFSANVRAAALALMR